MKSPEITATCMMKKTSNITHHKRRKYHKIAISEDMGSNEKMILQKQITVSTWLKTDQPPCHITKLCEILSRKNMWNTLQKDEELPEWAILLPSVQDIQDWRPKWISRIFGNQDWKETRWDTRMNSANPDTANFERSRVRTRGAQRRTKHPNINDNT
jgi:hypothetical protein